MIKNWEDVSWEEYIYWQSKDKKVLNITNNIIEKAFNKKLAAHIDIGKMIDTLTDDRNE